MAVFPQGYIWPEVGAGVGKNQAAPVAVTLTAAYVASTFQFEVHEQSRLLCRANLGAGGTEDPCLQVRVDVSWDFGVTWENGFQEHSIPALEVGDQYFYIDLPSNWHAATWRIACRDMLADADTTLVVYAESLIRGAGETRNAFEDQPIELTNPRTLGVIAWHVAGAAAALGLNYAASGSWIPVGRATEMKIWALTAGGPATSIEFEVEESFDDATTAAVLPVTNNIVAGVQNTYPREVQIQSAAGTIADDMYESVRIDVTPGSWIRLQAKRTGAAVNLLAHVRLFRV